MARLWTEMTGPELAALARRTDLALLPVGSIEQHGPHLPTGTDGFWAEQVARRLADQEPCAVLPTLFFNTAAEQRAFPGAIAFPPHLVVELYRTLCLEAARNGFRKILILIGHGGSEPIAAFFQRVIQEESRREDRSRAAPYQVFLSTLFPNTFPPDVQERIAALRRSPPGVRDGHGGELETAHLLLARPELVHLDRLEPLPEGTGLARDGLLQPFTRQVQSPTDWSERAPKGYVGQPHHATAAQGQELLALTLQALLPLVRQIRALPAPVPGR